jgi:hypothetical protein
MAFPGKANLGAPEIEALMKKLVLYLNSILCAALLAACSGRAGQPQARQNSLSDRTPTTEEPSSAAETDVPFRAELENFGPAPELTNEVWLNTEAPLRLADLRGKVVLLEMWTFG